MRKCIFLVISILFLFIILKIKRNVVLGDNIHLKFKSSPVFATINEQCDVYYEKDLASVIKSIEAGEKVEILEDRGEKLYLIKSDNKNLKGWVLAQFLNIPQTPISNKQKLNTSEVQEYINDKGLDSKTDYLIFTDIDRQLTYILKGKLNDWKLQKTIICSTGKNTSPTTRGTFKIKDKGEWFFSERLGSGAKYWIRFNGAYLFHSIPMDKNYNITDYTLGERHSSGCIRMNIDDIRWVYENIPYGTTVFID